MSSLSSPPTEPPPGGVSRTTGRVARNVGVRMSAELVGKFSTLALMALLARSEGPSGLGTLLFALAWTELAAAPISMGIDRHLLRLVARDRAQLDLVFWNVLALKLIRAVPMVAVSWSLAGLIGYESTTRIAIYLLTVSFLFEAVRETLFAAFNALERATLVGVVLVAQRFATAGIGVLALVLGYGVIGVATAFLAGVAIATAIGAWLLARRIGMPRIRLPAAGRRELRRTSVSLAVEDLLAAGIARVDAVLLSILATTTVIGLYGAAYRLLEATIFISNALLGAFSAMYTYLDDRSTPTVAAAYARSIKLSFVLLLPLAVAFAVLPEPILILLFGDGFERAAGALRVLAPTLVILGIVILSASLVASRLDARPLVRALIPALVVNLVANAALIPVLEATGAALAMLLTEALLLTLYVRIAARAVGYPPIGPTFGAGTAAAGCMAGVLLLLAGLPLLALAVGVVVYAGVFLLVERRLAPDDLRYVVELVRGRLRGGPTGPVP